MTETRERAIIVGGGVGGLSTALALRNAGIEARVFERAPELRDVGCVGIWVDGMTALDRLGLADAVQSRGWSVEVHEWRSWRGDVLFRHDVGELVREYGLRQSMNIPRAELLRTLFEELGEGVVEFGAMCVGFEQDDRGVTARFADGREERGAVLVAADGVDSNLRKTISDVPLRYAPYTYARALTEFDHPALPPGKFSVTLGRGDRFVTIHTSKDLRCWFAVTMTDGTSQARKGEAEDRFTQSAAIKAELLDRFRSFPPPTVEMIEATPAEEIFRNEIKDVPRALERWSDGRVTLLGDAAHAMTPNLGRGAGEAMQDAVALARCLARASLTDHERVAAALQSFEEMRKPVVTNVQARSWKLGQTASWRNPIACRFREQMMKRRMSTRIIEGNRREFAALAGRMRVKPQASLRTS